jgi:hypothetical protein
MRYLLAIAVLLPALQSAAQITNSVDQAIAGTRKKIADEGCEIPVQLTALVGLNAEQRARAAALLNDFRYIGILRRTIVEIPGVAYSASLCPIDASQVQVFVDDADPFYCPVYADLVKSLGTFASQYNVLIKKAREERGIDACASNLQ